MATTTNFGWETPDDTDLVKDGAAAMRTLGNSIDTSFVDLKGGTTGQVLSKATNTDLDYTWVTPQVGDITAVTAGTGISGGGTGGDVTITNSMATAIDAKGDLIAGTGADAFSRLAVGANDTVLTADSSTATGLKWAAPAAGGGWTSIASGSLSTGTLSLTSISGSYKNLRLVMRNADTSASCNMTLRVNNLSTGIYGRATIFNNDAAFGSAASQNQTSSQLNGSTIKLERTNTAIITFDDYANTTSYKQFSAQLSYEKVAAGLENAWTVGNLDSVAAISRIDIILSTGTFRAGTYILYGGN